MKKIIIPLSMLWIVLFVGCSSEYTVEYQNETFTLGNSLTYEMPILDSSILSPNHYDLSKADLTHTFNTYWLSDPDNYLSEVHVKHRLHAYDFEEIPFFVFPLDESVVSPGETVVDSEMVEINGNQWFRAETEPLYFDSEGKEMMSFTHEYHYRSSFELYSYIFKWMSPVEDFGDQEKLDNSFERMEEIISMAEFSRVPSMDQADLQQRLNGIWDAGQAGRLHFKDNELKWYQSEAMDEENVLHIELSEIEALIHPQEDVEYAYLELEYLSEVVGGQTHDSDKMLYVFVNFMSDEQIIFIDLESASQYILNKVEESS